VSIFPEAEPASTLLTHRQSRIDRLHARKDGREAARFRKADQAELVTARHGTT